MRRVGVGAEKPDKNVDAKTKKEIKDLKAENKQLKIQNEDLKVEIEKLKANESGK